MIFENRTPYSAGLLRTSLGDGSLVGSVLVRILYAIEDAGGGEVLRPLEELLPCPATGEETIFGVFETDAPYDKNGVDLVVVGHVYPPAPPAIATTATIRTLGAQGHRWERSVAVIGDRVWRRQGRQWTTTSPVPFDRMEISLARAFGGSSGKASCGSTIPSTRTAAASTSPRTRPRVSPSRTSRSSINASPPGTTHPIPPGWGFAPTSSAYAPARPSNSARDDRPPSIWSGC